MSTKLNLLAGRQSDRRCQPVREAGTGISRARPIWITADQGRITQVVSNLITNSCKYSPPSISISVQIGRQGDQVVISVEDEGFGISPEDLAEIYAPFFRSDRKVIRNEVGTGLGLAR